MVDKMEKGSSRMMTALPVLLTFIAIPLSMLFWVGNIALSALIDSRDVDVIEPTRWLAATLIPIVIAVYGLKKRSLSISGAILGLFVGFVLTLSSYVFLACLMTFFITGSKATKFRSERKAKLEQEFKEGGQRSWMQVLCNAGMATQLALLYIVDAGCGERPVDFVNDYRASWLALGVLGALSCCNGDTWASELGTVVGSGDPVLITSWRRVPRGTNGGVSAAGLVFSMAGGLVVGVAFYASLLYTVDTAVLSRSPPQWPVVLWAGIAGLVGSLLDSLLGATLQFTGVDRSSGAIVEHAGEGVRHISGLRVLDNHSVNLVSSILIGLLTPRAANLFWPD